MTKQPTEKQDGADDIAILHPERQQTIAGVAVTMREYGFIEGVQLAEPVRHVVDALSDVAFSGELLTPHALRPAFTQHLDDVITLMAAASDQPEAWVRGLNDADGQALMLLWWVTNADFFVRRVIEAVTVRHMTQASVGQTPTPASSAPDTTPRASASTRVVN
ncbi:DUF6631 family protein [Rhodanobacter sp. OR92]|uniref:DUF6631 family protein n=1 Tax=Rhodanobacter sp. OR92 TaxID=1076524 RepID=UPI0004299D1E|nr:DUF6631 family protein [Rhodanobacter sp. OR92]